MPTATTRRATEADATSLAPLLEQLGYPTNVDDIRARLDRLNAAPDVGVLVAESDGALVGLATFQIFELIYRPRPQCRLTALVVDSRHRRQGTGAELLQAVERIDRLVLICTAAHMPPPSRWQERAATVLAAGSVESIADVVVNGWLTPEYAAEHPPLRAALRSMLAESPVQGYVGCCGAIERMDLRGALPAVKAPTLVISGSEDPATPPEHQKLIAEAIPGARHEVVGPAAHLAAIEQPDSVNQLILEHLS